MVIKYFAEIRSLSGRKEEQWAKAAPTLGWLLTELAKQYGAAFRQRIFEGDQLSSTMVIFVNGKDCEFLGKLEAPLTSEDVVAIFPVLAVHG